MRNIKGCLFLAGAFSLAGTSVISANFVTAKLGTFTIAALSLAFSCLSLLPFTLSGILIKYKTIKLKSWFNLFLQALFGIFLFRTFLLIGLLHTTSGEAGIMTGFTPVATAILAWLILKEGINSNKLFGIILTMAGILLIQGLLLPGSKIRIENILGNALVLLAAVSESVFNIFSRIISLKGNKKETAFSPLEQTAVVSVIALLLCIFPAVLEHPVNALLQAGIKEWIALMWYGFIVTALAFKFWYEGIKRCQATTAAAFSGLMPFTSLLLSVVLLGEVSDLKQWAGGLLVIAGIILTGIKEGQRNPLASRQLY